MRNTVASAVSIQSGRFGAICGYVWNAERAFGGVEAIQHFRARGDEITRYSRRPRDKKMTKTDSNTLYVSDLDGTLLRDDAVLSARSFAILSRLLRDGMPFTVASARSVVSMQQVLGDLPLALPVIEFNGAFLTDYSTGKHLVVNAIDSGLCAEILVSLRCSGVEPFVSAFDGEMDCLYHERIVNEGMLGYLNSRIDSNDRRVRDPIRLDQCLGHKVVCFTIIDGEKRLVDLRCELEERYGERLVFHLYQDPYSGWHWLTMHDRRSTKDQAIRRLQSMFGLDEHSLTVFGDHINDIRMFQIADTAVAVSNAQPSVMPYASEIIGSNMEDSVAEYLEREYVKAGGKLSNQ